MKTYPLKIENVGEDDYMLMSRGHHDFKQFMEACYIAHPNWSMGNPVHIWFKSTPDRRSEYSCRYTEVSENVRGAFPVTYTVEAYGEDKYKIVESDLVEVTIIPKDG
jgi:hypothetical protein